MKNWSQHILRLSCLVGLLLHAFAVSPALALSVSPLVIEMSALGQDRRAQLTVFNESSAGTPVEIVVSRMDIKENGAITTQKAGEDFLIFPPQSLIPSGAQQVFRIEWVGDPDLKKSESFIFSVNQLPVALSKQSTGVQLVLNITTIVNVAPPQSKAAITLYKSEIIETNKGDVVPRLVLGNPTNKHARLSDADIHLKTNTWSKTLSSEELRETLGLGLIQPGKRRQFILPVKLPENTQSLQADIIYPAH